VVDRSRRERLLTFLLLPAVVIAALVLMGVMIASGLQLQKLQEQSVVDATRGLADEKADRLDKRIIEQDNAVMSDLDLGDRRNFGEAWLKVAQIQTPTVRAVLVVDLDSDSRDVVAFASRAPGPEDERFRRLLVHSIIADMNLDEPNLDELRHLHKGYAGQSYLVSHWERQVAGRRYLVVAWHDVPRIVHELFPQLYSETDPQSRVNIVDSDGRIIYGRPLSRGRYTLSRRFETTLYKWSLYVSTSSAGELAAVSARRRVFEYMVQGLAGLVIVAGLAVVLVAAARERKLSSLKGEFVANVSHELKTPLSLVRMFGELLLSGRVESDAKRTQYLQIIVTESERLAAMIENVLDFAKVERGKAAYEFVDGNLADVVARAVDACRTRAENENVELDLEVSAELPPILLDERAIEIAVINLIDNALKYAPDGKRIGVRVRRSHDRVEIRVSDQGPGIPADDRKRIFERFVRGASPMSKQVRGSGIGLALVKHIAEAHGGKAWVEPETPHGSTFVITLRVHPAPAGAEAGRPVTAD
jgi:two-component system phosphate regulon sensor histidine kinase PhoR